jgi:hypothetical protein
MHMQGYESGALCHHEAEVYESIFISKRAMGAMVMKGFSMQIGRDFIAFKVHRI